MASSSSPSWTRLARLPWLPWLAVMALVLTAATVSAVKSLPPSWKLCSHSDPNLDECLVEAFNKGAEELATKGLKGFGIPPIDPFKIEELTVKQETGRVALTLMFKNVSITGFKDIRFKEVRYDKSSFSFKIKLETVPKLTLTGDYKISGNILLLSISGQGKCVYSMERVHIEAIMVGGKQEKHGQKYGVVSKFIFTAVEPEFASSRFDNLFNGNKQLSDQMNKFMNANWQAVLKELQGPFNEAMGLALRDATNQILSQVPKDKLFTQ